jgi:DNA replication initiation complex subunit (GINS family)
MITYNDIYEAARKERYSDQLRALPKNFVDEVGNYLKDKKEVAAREDDGFSDVIMKTKKQLENAITLFKELMVRRRKKILGLVLIAAETGISKHDFDNMLNFEKELFESLAGCVDLSRKKLEEMMNGGETKKNNDMVVFKEDIGEVVGLDAEKIGPFIKGEMANIPKEIAKILLEDGKIELVE